MKTTILKTVTLSAAILLAASGAFASQASAKRAFTPVTGYIDSPLRCQLAVQCSDVPGAYCTAQVGSITYQVFGKIIPALPICSIALYRPDF